MRDRLGSIAICLAATAAFATSVAPGGLAAPARVGAAASVEREPLVVHEWGTFTSVAGENGSAVRWLPQAGPNDLPCFVHRNPLQGKTSLSGTVRMETPVLYFYATQETTVDVHVGFRRGVMTEWFPRAEVTPAGPIGPIPSSAGFEGAIDWRDVKLMPGAPQVFPTDQSSSHYYAARRTQSTPLQLGTERERFLFYRGVGDFPPPLSATVAADGRVVVTNVEERPLGRLLLFQNRGGVRAYRFLETQRDQATFDPLLRDQATVDPSSQGETPEALFSQLEGNLIAAGLYQQEAAAMIDTWRDSWFEEGTRLIYIVPRPQVDAMVPLEITPRPAEIARVFVGRVELITARAILDVANALAVNDRSTLDRYGRFLQPIGDRILSASAAVDRGARERTLQSVYNSRPAAGLQACTAGWEQGTGNRD